MNIKLDDMARYQAFYLWLAANAALDERVDKTLRVAELGVKVLEILSNGTLEYDDKMTHADRSIVQGQRSGACGDILEAARSLNLLTSAGSAPEDA